MILTYSATVLYDYSFANLAVILQEKCVNFKQLFLYSEIIPDSFYHQLRIPKFIPS